MNTFPLCRKLGLALALLPVFAAAADPVLPPLAPEFRGSIRSVTPKNGEKVIALTFDLCEGGSERSGYDSKIVEYLRREKIRATFFAGGKWLRSHPEESKKLMADPLFEIGNHGWSHRNLRTLHSGEMESEVTRAQEEYALLREELSRSEATDKVPALPRLFRFPFGACDAKALDFLARRGLYAVQWSVVPGDPSPAASAEAIAGEIVSRAKPGAIVVLHANGRGLNTAEALPLFAPELLRRGYSFVTVSELLQKGTPKIAGDCYELSPGDNFRYDAPPKKDTP
ncbi:polysaccharide deacetylase [bacterium]|nr:MAG: polysaccharide deacetylase [bacterium]